MDDIYFYSGAFAIALSLASFIFIFIFWEKAKYYYHLIPYLLCFLGICLLYKKFFFWEEENALIALAIFLGLLAVIHVSLYFQLKYETPDKE